MTTYKEYQELADKFFAAKRNLKGSLIEEGITGVLTNVYFKDYGLPMNGARYPNLGGTVEVDTKGRFLGGESISTSRVEKIYVKDGRTFAKTAFSLYELIDFNPETVPEDFRYAFQDL
jgi:hypothetical protein